MTIDLNCQAVEMPNSRREGQTGIYRRNGFQDALLTVPPSRPHITTIYEAFQNGLKTSPNGECLGTRTFDHKTGLYAGYEWQTYSQVNERITLFGSGLLKVHQEAFGLTEVAQRWSVGLWAINRAEWTIASEACSAYNLVSVGLYDTLGPDAVVYGINHSESPIVVTSVDHIASLLNDSAKMPGLKAIICMDPLDESAKKAPGIEAIGTQHGRKHTPATPSDTYTICYTSGTTGLPKGAILTHGNVTAVIASADVTMPMTSDDTVISFLPLPHVFGRVMELFMLATGARIGYSTGDQLLLLEDIANLKPTVFPAVPRLLNRVYAKIYSATVEAPGLTGVLARHGLATKLANLQAGKGIHHAFWDRLLFSKIKQALGGNVRLMITASAPISAEILGFLRVAFCCEVIEAYGQTEGSGAATNTGVSETEAGHVGPPNACSELKLVDVPELNYFSTDKPYPRGEICVRGPAVFAGYLKDEKKTRETIDDEGWLHSGDVGIIAPNGTMTVIDRIKNVFKLAQGEYIAAEKVENSLLSRLPVLQQLMVHGDSTEVSLIAIVVPDPETFVTFVNKLMPSVKLQVSDIKLYHELCRHPEVRQAFIKEIAKAGRAAGLKGFEIPKNILVESEPFTVENGKLTPTFKAKRHPIVQEYRERLTQLYKELNQSASKL
ncbi:hypothetical protein BGZ94_003587 [Podila epigama]|nr:hypothetical protein BGZ94_003587 [Podila epigama]